MDYFSLLGLPRGYALDREQLERAYFERAQRTHPDRFVGAGSAEQRVAMEHSAALNEGYSVLRDPVRRAEYVCRLAGIDVDSNEPTGGAPEMSQAFLIEMIERREAVEQARQAGPVALDVLRDGVETELDDALDRAVAALGQGSPPQAAQALVERRYLKRLLDEIEGEVGH